MSSIGGFMYKMCLLWFFSGFFTISVLAADHPPKGDHSPQGAGENLYFNISAEGPTVSGRFVERPELFKNATQAVATLSNNSPRGFLVTKRTFVHWGIEEIPPALRAQRENEKSTGQLLQNKELTQSERAERLRTVRPRNFGPSLFNAVFKRNGIVTRLISAYSDPQAFRYVKGHVGDSFVNQWTFLEVKGYEGPVAELADFNETNTDEIYFVTTGDYLDILDIHDSTSVMQITGIANKREADHLELGSISPNIPEYYTKFNRGFAVNSKGKIIGFLVWGNYEKRMYLIKVTSKLRRIFTENTAEAREVPSGCYNRFF